MKNSSSGTKPAGGIQLFGSTRGFAAPPLKGLPARMRQAIDLVRNNQAGRAEPLLQQIVREWPAAGEAWRLLALVQVMTGHPGALRAFEKASTHYPDDAELHCNWGVALQDAGNSSEAIEKFKRAIELQPDLAHAHNNLGTELLRAARWQDAKLCFEQAIAFSPNMAQAHSNLASACYSLGDHSAARAAVTLALALDPSLVTALMALGQLDLDASDFSQAVVTYQRVLDLEPENFQSMIGKAQALVGLARIDEALECLGKGLTLAIRNEGADRISFGLLAYSNFLAHYLPSGFAISPKQLAQLFGREVALMADPDPERPAPQRKDGQPLRVGLVSGDLGDHPVGYFLQSTLKALRAHHGRDIEIVLVSTNDRDDEIAQELRNLAHTNVSIDGVNNQEAARLVRDHEIHVLVDLSGFSEFNRLGLFGWRPSPVQVTWLGYFATTGLREIDYVIADPRCVEPATETQFWEKVWYLPTLRMCFTPPGFEVTLNEPLPGDARAVTFGCFNNLLKLNAQVIETWSQILRRVPQSRLLLKTAQFEQPGVVDGLLDKFVRHGIDPRRILTDGRSPRREYLERYNDIDICLDPFPYSGGTTTCDALWMGVPVLTLRGETMIGRQSASYLDAMGLQEWIAVNPTEYVEKAVQFALDPTSRPGSRQTLRQRFTASAVCDAKRLAQDLTDAFLGMWTAWESRQRQDGQASPQS